MSTANVESIVSILMTSPVNPDKRDYFSRLAKGVVTSYLNMKEFPLDNQTIVDVTAQIAVRLYKTESANISLLKARNIEGYSETFIDGASGLLSDSEKEILNNFSLIHSDFSYSNTVPVLVEYPSYSGYVWPDPYYLGTGVRVYPS